MSVGRLRWLLLPLGLLLGGACANQATLPDSGPALPSSTSGGVSSGGATSSGTGTSSSSTSSSGSSTGGTTSSLDCATDCYATTCAIGDCDAGSIEIKLGLKALQGCPVDNAVAGAQLSDLDDPSLVATSDACGVATFCVAPGTVLDLQVVAGGYFTTTVQDIDATVSEIPRGDGIPLPCNAFFSALSTAGLKVTPDSSLPFLFAHVSHPPGPLDGGLCFNSAGWTLSLLGSDGGVLPSVSAFFAGGMADPTATVTDSSGDVILYNVEIEGNGVAQIQLGRADDQNVLPDGGLLCGNLGPDPDLTHTVHLIAGTASYADFILQ